VPATCCFSVLLLLRHSARPTQEVMLADHFCTLGCCRVQTSISEQPPADLANHLQGWELPPTVEQVGGVHISARFVSNDLTLHHCQQMCSAEPQCDAFEFTAKSLDFANHIGSFMAPPYSGTFGACWNFRVGPHQRLTTSCDVQSTRQLCCSAKLDPGEPARTRLVRLARRRATLPRRSAAVCIRGSWHKLAESGPSIREFVLRPLNADAYAVLEDQSGGLNSRECEGILGPRAHGRCLVGSSPELYDARFETFYHTQGFADALPNIQGASDVPLAIRAMFLQRFACMHLILESEVARGFEYLKYASIRSDLTFFTPLPAVFFRPFEPSEAIIPMGDDWMHGVNDNLLFGGRDAFLADAMQWRLLQPATGFYRLGQPWTPEVLVMDSLSNITLTQPAVAYCKIARGGACRYFGQLRMSMQLHPRLLDEFPHAADRLCLAASSPSGIRSTPVQTSSDFILDGYWQNLSSWVASETRMRNITCQFSGQVFLQHR